MQRVYFNCVGKLQVETDNGLIKDNGEATETKIAGDFVIGANDVARLLTHISGKITHTKIGFLGNGNAWYLATDKVFEEASARQAEIENELHKMEISRNNLLRKIEEHNDKCEGFFNRKWKIKL